MLKLLIKAFMDMIYNIYMRDRSKILKQLIIFLSIKENLDYNQFCKEIINFIMRD